MARNKDIYEMYEEEFYKVEKLNKIINNQKLEIDTLKYELKYSKEKVMSEVNKTIKPYKEENIKLKEELSNALKEIDRLKLELISKNEIEGAASSYINKQDGIKKEVFILVLNCIFFLIALAVFLVITWNLLTFFTVLIFLLTFTPCLIIVILTSISLKFR